MSASNRVLNVAVQSGIQVGPQLPDDRDRSDHQTNLPMEPFFQLGGHPRNECLAGYPGDFQVILGA